MNARGHSLLIAYCYKMAKNFGLTYENFLRIYSCFGCQNVEGSYIGLRQLMRLFSDI